ncbi:hypothetical protein GQR58_005653 [Nymphon striatum]|nr:hypothetical protein GQR58_005653 [Nymphon striatum]
MGGRSRWDGFPNSWGYKRAGRQSGRGKRRKQTSVYVSSLCRASISEQRDYLPSGQGGKEEEFGGERSGYRGGRRPRSSGGGCWAPPLRGRVFIWEVRVGATSPPRWTRSSSEGCRGPFEERGGEWHGGVTAGGDWAHG